MKIALVYDRVNKWGGAEQVLLALHRLFPDAPLYTSVYKKEKTEWASEFDIKCSFLQDFPKARTSHELYALLMPVAFESFNFDSYDVVISVTSEAAKGIITKPSTLHICICLTPTRYLWSGYSDYFTNGIFAFLSRPAIGYLKLWDKIVSQRPDYYIAISSSVASRIEKYYSIKSNVIYPPLLEKSHKSSNNQLKKDYYLVVSRLVRYKRIDIAVDAANNLGFNLKIVGEGSEKNSLIDKAGSSVEFLGFVSEDKLCNLYREAAALLFCGIEDFGLAMVQAQLHGTPVVAYSEGGASEIVIEGKTGEFFDEQTPDSLVAVLEKFDNSRYNSLNCIENAKRFYFERFEKEFMKFFNEKVNEYFE